MRSDKTRRSIPGGGFELYSWFFMRVSGVLLVGFVLIHLVIMHIINNVDVIDFDFVAARWADPAWRLYDIILLTVALAHGANGLRIVMDDYVHSKLWRTLAVAGLYTAAFIVYAIGLLSILTFRGA